MDENKRNAPRVHKQIRAEVHAPDGFTFSSSLDISEKGIFITTPEPIEPSTEVTLIISLTKSDSISVQGIVRWNRYERGDQRAGMGVEFIDVSDVALNIIKNLCEG